ncbi:unnamed protein product [Caenorhabditis auriculariae]|uniref:Uncharacterized protein n=1 Tax=Caenorhabditis auriculariae TaxID=2777116 RepID=A0A8S1H2P3_9PELO|nr:unnamed protein product [Caenorhabditis auriculariae]
MMVKSNFFVFLLIATVGALPTSVYEKDLNPIFTTTPSPIEVVTASTPSPTVAVTKSLEEMEMGIYTEETIAAEEYDYAAADAVIKVGNLTEEATTFASPVVQQKNSSNGIWQELRYEYTGGDGITYRHAMSVRAAFWVLVLLSASFGASFAFIFFVLSAMLLDRKESRNNYSFEKTAPPQEPSSEVESNNRRAFAFLIGSSFCALFMCILFAIIFLRN